MMIQFLINIASYWPYMAFVILLLSLAWGNWLIGRLTGGQPLKQFLSRSRGFSNQKERRLTF
ncbi:hypothetical protein [Dyadobacter sp. CY312]|uniref:hypothetical protein n=1 Tax=Dyadobacter sp. CY312 TaxID=2907303 RepID=UPI001F40C3D8|nr:hypothetical protein [Dyadobacter sp. CY312]MCE7040475.1 hypothetical protein [Dyadobacter sp. CY312]